MRRAVACLVLLGLLAGSTRPRAEDDDACPAPNAALDGVTLDPSEPPDPVAKDCGFYQRAWQAFLEATAPTSSGPAFLGYETFEDLYPKARTLTARAAAGPRVMALAVRTAKESGPVFHEAPEQALSGGVLVDGNGNPVFYAIHVNPAFAKFVRDRQLTDIARLRADSDLDAPPGMVELKSAWQIVPDGQSLPTDHITADAVVPTLVQTDGKLGVDSTKPRSVRVRLLALHVVFTLSNHPEMIWSTFEHVSGGGFDLAPRATAIPMPCEQPVSAASFTLYQAGTKAGDANGTVPITLDAARQTLAPRSQVYRHFPWAKQPDAQHPGEAVAEDGAVANVNRAEAELFKAAPDDRRGNYALSGAVWIRKGAADFKAGVRVKDDVLAGENGLSNMAMESFTQSTFLNCFSCHQPLRSGGLGPGRLNVSHIFVKASREAP